MESTWQPYPPAEKAYKLSPSDYRRLPKSVFAFPADRREPLINAVHVESAARWFVSTRGVTDEELALAWANINAAARYYGVDLGDNPSARKAVGARRRTR